MKWKLWLRNLSVSAPRVAVRTQLSWPLRAVVVFVLLSLAVAAGFTVYKYGRNLDGPDHRAELMAELERTRDQLAQAVEERNQIAAVAVQWESRVNVDRAAQ